MLKLYPTDDQAVFLGVRQLLSHYPEAAHHGPNALRELLYTRRFLLYRPEPYEVEAALEALDVERGAA